MKIKYSHAAGITAELPPGDSLAQFAVSAYGFALGTPERLNKWHSGPEFAAAIREVFAPDDLSTAAVLRHLETL